ncbi:hypothetical protein NP161_23895, partial [Salmonella enterica]|nr:hypothetical protein [Salmonella enterica]
YSAGRAATTGRTGAVFNLQPPGCRGSALRLPELRSSLVKLNRCHWILVMVKSARIPLLPL